MISNVVGVLKMNINISLFLLLTHVASTFSANILGIFHLHVKSHYTFFRPLLVRLAERGHAVTVYTPFIRPKTEIISNFAEIDISMCNQLSKEHSGIDFMLSTFGSNVWRLAFLFPYLGSRSVEDIETCSPLLKLLNSTTKYDLLIAESFVSDAMLMFANKFDVPFITTTPNVLAPYQAARVANAANPSYVPTFGAVTAIGYQSSMNFWQRVVNTVTYVISIVVYYAFTMRKEDAVIRHFLGSSAPSLYDTVKNTSLIFSNSDSCLNPAFPMVPNVVQVSGMQIETAKPIPKVRFQLVLSKIFYTQRALNTRTSRAD